MMRFTRARKLERGEGIEMGRSKMEFHIVQISDHPSSKHFCQPADKVEFCRKRTTNWYRIEDQRFDESDSSWTKLH